MSHTCTSEGCMSCLKQRQLRERHLLQVEEIEARDQMRILARKNELQSEVRTLEEIMKDIRECDDPDESRLLFEEKRKWKAIQSML